MMTEVLAKLLWPAQKLWAKRCNKLWAQMLAKQNCTFSNMHNLLAPGTESGAISFTNKTSPNLTSTHN